MLQPRTLLVRMFHVKHPRSQTPCAQTGAKRVSELSDAGTGQGRLHTGLEERADSQMHHRAPSQRSETILVTHRACGDLGTRGLPPSHGAQYCSVPRTAFQCGPSSNARARHGGNCGQLSVTVTGSCGQRPWPNPGSCGQRLWLPIGSPGWQLEGMRRQGLAVLTRATAVKALARHATTVTADPRRRGPAIQISA